MGGGRYGRNSVMASTMMTSANITMSQGGPIRTTFRFRAIAI
jgi:hypothetical protein